MNPTPRNQLQRPLPRQIYLRRRIAAVVVLVLVVLLLWWVVGALTGGDDATTNTANQATSATNASATKGSKKPAKTKESASKSPKETDDEEAGDEDAEDRQDSAKPGSDDAAAKDTCTVADLRVTATPGAPSFGEGRQPNFFASVDNPTKADCVVDFSTEELKFEVFTMNNYQRVWADTDCNKPEVSGDVTIPAGSSVNYELKAWSRTTSAPDQCSDRQPVEAGSYLLYAHVGQNTSQPATFNLG